MNKYFTKPYIKECDCEEIQGLRPKGRNHYNCYFIARDTLACDLMKNNDFGEWIIHIHGIGESFYYSSCEGGIGQTPKKELKEYYIWLPTGDQLDDGIVKICSEKELEYDFGS